MEYSDKKEFYELQNFVDTIEAQKELYEETEQDSWTIDLEDSEDHGPVNEETVQYVLGPLDSFLELWNNVDDTIKELEKEYRQEPDKRPRLAEEYRELKERIFDNSDFLEEVYDLERALGWKKQEARYPW